MRLRDQSIQPFHQSSSVQYEFTGQLVTTSGLHIGSGHGDFTTDARVVRTAQDQFYIPGSSFKGALRSATERMVASLASQSLRTCLLDPQNQQCEPPCPTVHEAWQSAFALAQEQGMDEDDVAAWLYSEDEQRKGNALSQVTLCNTCRLFGSPYVASKVVIPDLIASTAAAGEIRHGVGIDRDTGAARAQIKFDYETTPSQSVFAFRLVANGVTSRELGLLCAGLRQFEQEAVTLGGRAARGLGNCCLKLTQIVKTDLTSPAAWLDRLVHKPDQIKRGVETYTLESKQTLTGAMDEAIEGLLGELVANEQETT